MVNQDAVPVVEANARLWTLEEISQLVSRRGNPSETLTNIVELIQQRFATDVCSVYLLEPDRANAGAGRHGRPAPRERRAASAMWLNEGLAGLVAEQVQPARRRRRLIPPALQVLPRGRRRPYRSFLGVPVVDRGVLQGVLVVQTIDARAVRRRRRAHAGDGRRATGADRQRGAQARALRRAGPPAAVRPGAQPVVELGRGGRRPLPRPRPGALARVRPQPDRAAAADLVRPARGARVALSRCTAASTTPTAGLQEYLQSQHTWGAGHRERARGTPGGLLLGRVRPARIAADLLRRPGRAGRRPPQERLGPGHPAGRRRAVLRPGLLPAASRRRTAGSRRTT